jgi:hypothetical protein
MQKYDKVNLSFQKIIISLTRDKTKRDQHVNFTNRKNKKRIP